MQTDTDRALLDAIVTQQARAATLTLQAADGLTPYSFRSC
jgi:hypothetical protein